MAHRSIKSGYSNLSDRLNRFPQGAPPSELLFSILKILFTAKKASRIWKMELTDTNNTLDTLAGRAILVDIERNNDK